MRASCCDQGLTELKTRAIGDTGQPFNVYFATLAWNSSIPEGYEAIVHDGGLLDCLFICLLKLCLQAGHLTECLSDLNSIDHC